MKEALLDGSFFIDPFASPEYGCKEEKLACRFNITTALDRLALDKAEVEPYENQIFRCLPTSSSSSRDGNAYDGIWLMFHQAT